MGKETGHQGCPVRQGQVPEGPFPEFWPVLAYVGVHAGWSSAQPPPSGRREQQQTLLIR